MLSKYQLLWAFYVAETHISFTWLTAPPPWLMPFIIWCLVKPRHKLSCTACRKICANGHPIQYHLVTAKSNWCWTMSVMDRLFPGTLVLLHLPNYWNSVPWEVESSVAIATLCLVGIVSDKASNFHILGFTCMALEVGCSKIEWLLQDKIFIKGNA